MYGKTNVFDLTCCFLFLCEVPHIVFVELCGAFATDVVEQIVINIIKAHAFERNVKAVVGRFFVGERPGKTFRGNGEGIAWVASDECFAERCFGCTFVVDECSIEVGIPCFHEDIDHLFELGKVNARLIVGVKKRKSHATKAHF